MDITIENMRDLKISFREEEGRGDAKAYMACTSFSFGHGGGGTKSIVVDEKTKELILFAIELGKQSERKRVADLLGLRT